MPKDPFKIKVADFSKPRPFKTVQGAMHSYTYLPFIGWLPPVELNIMIALIAIALAISLPQPTIGRKLLAFVMVFVAIAIFAAAFVAFIGLLSWLNRRYFLLLGRSRLARRLKNPNVEARRDAAWTLGTWEADAAPAASALIEALRDSDKTVRERAVDALGRIGPGAHAAVPALVAMIPGSETAWEIAAALGKIGPEAEPAVPALIELLRGSTDLNRSTAAEALGNIGSRAAAAVPGLIAALADSYYITRANAAAALAKIGEAATPALPALIKALEDKETYWQAARSLGRLGAGSKEAEAALTALLTHPDERHREEAERALARLVPPRPLAGEGGGEGR